MQIKNKSASSHTFEMYASDVLAYTHLCTNDLDLETHDLEDLYSNAT